MKLIDSWVYEIRPDRHVLIVTFGTLYQGSDRPRRTAEHRQLKLFGRTDVSKLPMPAPYKRSIERWFDLARG